MYLKIWRLHPQGVRIVPAEKTLNGHANPSGVKFCGPYKAANETGWWVFPAQDVDILYKGHGDFEYVHHTRYEDSEVPMLKAMVGESRPYLNRTKYLGGVLEDNVVQIWTGVILQTPFGWGLRMRNPVNCHTEGYKIMEGVLETDWMFYDLWTNLQFTEIGKWVHLRKDMWPPLAHLTLEPRADPVVMQENYINSPDGKAVFDYWHEYNEKKYAGAGKQYASPLDPNVKKDSALFFKERKRILSQVDDYILGDDNSV